MFDKDSFTEKDLINMKTIFCRASDNAKLIILGDTSSSAMYGELKMIKCPKMECSNSELYHSKEERKNE